MTYGFVFTTKFLTRATESAMRWRQEAITLPDFEKDFRDGFR